jgi:4-amino-4-deoxy-L-arabinose transferase-like glycosyltransferase
MLLLSYVLYGLTAHLVLRDRVLATIATLGLITFPQVGYEAQRDLTHTVAVLFSACLFVCFFFRALQRPTLLNYAATGLAIGFGILSKYNFALLPLAAALALLPDQRLRARLFDPRILVMLAVAALAALPHALWLVEHLGEATGRTLIKLTAESGESRAHQLAAGLLSLASALAAFVVPTLLVFLVTFGGSLTRSWRARSEWTRLIGRMFAILLGLLVIVVLAGASDIKDRWLLPLFFLLPIYLCAKIEASGEPFPRAARSFGAIVIAIMILVPAVLLLRPVIGGAAGYYGKQNVPYGPALAEILGSNTRAPSYIVVEDQQIAGNFRLHAPDLPVVMPGYDYLGAPVIRDPSAPVLVIWRSSSGRRATDMQTSTRDWLAAHGLGAGGIAVHEAALPYHYGRDGDVYRFSYAWIDLSD